MKRLKMAIAALLAFALLPLIGSTALADESSASSRAEQIRAAANIETIADASTMGDCLASSKIRPKISVVFGPIKRYRLTILTFQAP